MNGRSENIIAAAVDSGTVPERDAQAVYLARKSAFAAARTAAHRRWNLLANIRLLAFITLGFGLWWTWRDRGAVPIVGTLIALVAVVWLVLIHGRLRRERERLDRLVRANVDALARLALNWDEAPEPPPAGVDRRHPYAFDLDIVGRASLAHRIATVTTRDGWTTLYRWLLQNQGSDDIRQRQQAVRELSGKIELRQNVEAAGCASHDEIPDPTALLNWAESTSRLMERPWIRLLAMISPATVVILAGLQAVGLLTLPFWLVPLTVNVVIFLVAGAEVSEIVARVAPMHRAIAGYRDVFALIATDDCSAPELRKIRELLGSGPDGATTQVTRLTQLGSLALPRGSILYYPAQMFLLWDIQVLSQLERWQRVWGKRVRSWLAAAGEWDALAALSVLPHDHPSWAFASIDAGPPNVTAEDLGHPLIEWGQMVRNDVAVGPAGTFLFVTGSNMSGKSTLLRAVGINAVLAMAGGPSCARALTMPPVDVRCCMRVEDSVVTGVSFFMAELRRLKDVVDAAGAARNRPVLYLLDEIMQGTNTLERQIASRAVLAQLTGTNAIGAISSHDLGLLADSPLDERSTKAHFAEQFRNGPDGPVMTFDYKLRPGIATSTNALKLMAILGFDVPAGTTGEADD